MALPFALYARVLNALDARSWALSGASMPSPLGRYCEAMVKPGVPEVAQAEMLLALGPTIKALCEQQDRLDAESGESDDGDSDVACAQDPDALQLPSPDTARQMRPVVLPQLLSCEDIAAIKELSQELSSKEHKKHAAGNQWRTRYLHADGTFRDRLPHLLARLAEAAMAVDSRESGWGLLAGADVSRLKPRVVEHHLVGPGGALPDPTHFDGGSVMTIDVMLSAPGVDFEGGEFCTAESDGSFAQHHFGLGDALVFVSHKPHCVRPVKAGLRETLIMELWDGPERRCDHRCQDRGRCALEEQVGRRAGQSGPGPEAASGPGSAHAAGAGGHAVDLALSVIARDAGGAFAATAFEGQAFFSRVAKILAQSDELRTRAKRRPGADEAAPNVEVVFEDVGAVATVRALRSIRRGETLVMAPCDAESEEDTACEAEESEDQSEEDEEE